MAARVVLQFNGMTLFLPEDVNLSGLAGGDTL